MNNFYDNDLRRLAILFHNCLIINLEGISDEAILEEQKKYSHVLKIHDNFKDPITRDNIKLELNDPIDIILLGDQNIIEIIYYDEHMERIKGYFSPDL